MHFSFTNIILHGVNKELFLGISFWLLSKSTHCGIDKSVPCKTSQNPSSRLQSILKNALWLSPQNAFFRSNILALWAFLDFVLPNYQVIHVKVGNTEICHNKRCYRIWYWNWGVLKSLMPAFFNRFAISPPLMTFSSCWEKASEVSSSAP